MGDLMDKELDLLIAEMMIKISAIERLLVKSNVIKADDIVSEMKSIAEDVVKQVATNVLLKKDNN
jgi:hypothetical protein